MTTFGLAFEGKNVLISGKSGKKYLTLAVANLFLQKKSSNSYNELLFLSSLPNTALISAIVLV